MSIHTRRILAALLAVLMLALSGCGPNIPSEDTSLRKKHFDIPEPINLKIVVDRYDVLAGYLEPLIEEFTAIYDNVTIEIISLPTDGDKKYSRIWEEKRREMIPEIYSEMNAGAGPDLFLLPGGHFLEDSLFPDVNIAMRQGCFADLNEYYLTDDELNRDDLVDEVMDFGVVGDARYLLPMTYSYQVAYVDMERLYEAGLDSSIFDSGVMSLLDAVCRLGDSNVADSTRGTGRGNLLTIFPNALDYDTGDVLLSKEELTEFLELVQEHTALWGDEFAGVGSFERYCSGTHWWQQGFCMNMGLLNSKTIEQAATAKALEFNLRMFPIRGVEGVLTAEMGFYGAVNANCKYPEVAYEFLRMFLLPGEASLFVQEAGGYHVRSYDYVSVMYQDYFEDFWQEASAVNTALESGNDEDRQKRLDILESVEVTDSDIPILFNTIEVTQSTPLEVQAELSSIISQLNDPATGEPTDVDIEKLAQGYIDYLTVYLKGQLGTE